MESKRVADWVGVEEAAALTGKSISTIRRLIPEAEAGGQLHRESKSGKVLFLKSYILKRYGGPGQPEAEAVGGGVIAMLEMQLEAQNRQIAALLREGEIKSRQIEEAQAQAAVMLENLRQAQALNAALQTKILTIGEGREGATIGGGVLERPAYFVGVAVVLTLICGVLVWLFLQWVGGG